MAYFCRAPSKCEHTLVTLRSIIVGQFRRPHGPLGHLAGLIMARRPSNRERNAWTVSLLALESHHQVLEIGCGPGLALKACATQVTGGRVVGIDHSETMVFQARHRLSPEIAAGRAEVHLGDLADITSEPAAYHRFLSLNVVQFFPDMEAAFRQIHACLVNQGLAATTFQPRSRNPTRKEAYDMAAWIAAAMRDTGFSAVRRHELPLYPVPVVCVTGIKGHAGSRPRASGVA